MRHTSRPERSRPGAFESDHSRARKACTARHPVGGFRTMINSAADSQFLAATIHARPAKTDRGAAPLRGGMRLNTAVTAAACLLGHCLYAWAACRGVMQQIVAFWLCLELAFFVWTCWRYRIINQLVDFRYEPARVAEVKRRFLRLDKCIPLEGFLTGWFLGSPIETIQRGNVEDFVAYGFYSRYMHELPPNLQDATAAFVRGIEEKWGRQLPEGRNPDIKFMAHVWEDLRVLPKPLALHAGCEVISLLGHAMLRYMGFRMENCQGFTYWIRQPGRESNPAPAEERPLTPSQSQGNTPSVSPMDSPSVSARSSADEEVDYSRLSRSAELLRMRTRSGDLFRTRSIIHRRGDSFSSLRSDENAGDLEDSEQRPLFFMHGVGLGLIPYLGLVQQILWACPDRPLILLEVPHVSLRLQLRAMSVDDVAHAAAQILWRHSYQEACFVAHSYGTFCASRICQLHRALVHSLVLIDPVCFLTCYPQLLYNFVYKVPLLSECLGSIEGLLGAARFLFSRDLIISETFCRKFQWHELMLWPEDMPQHALVCLSHNDDLVPSAMVKKHISDAHPTASVMYHPTAGHGGFLVDFPWQQQMVQGIKQLAELPEEGLAPLMEATSAKLDGKPSLGRAGSIHRAGSGLRRQHSFRGVRTQASLISRAAAFAQSG